MLSEEQRNLLNEAMARYSEHLDEALPYLKGRGISEATARTRGLGIVRDPVVGHENRVGRLAIPYVTQSGVVNMTFRCIQDHECKFLNHGKYLELAGAGTNLYGVNDIVEKNSLDICITEGEIDAIVLSEEVGIPAVGISGKDKWLPWWKQIFSDFRRVYVFKDGDEAGDKLAEKVQKEMGMKAVICRMPDGEDVNSAYLEYGADYLKGFIK